jgi:hypothetical protein
MKMHSNLCYHPESYLVALSAVTGSVFFNIPAFDFGLRQLPNYGPWELCRASRQTSKRLPVFKQFLKRSPICRDRARTEPHIVVWTLSISIFSDTLERCGPANTRSCSVPTTRTVTKQGKNGHLYHAVLIFVGIIVKEAKWKCFY